ncbi:MAG TPA: hypothetical protein VFX14_16265, partial [Methylomirabilota bacterium]|nr:hypothetical protein [Methylomirabilota bacterium]
LAALRGGLSSRVLLEEGHQHHADDIREQFAALHLGQPRHAVNDGGCGAEYRALDLSRVHRAGATRYPQLTT